MDENTKLAAARLMAVRAAPYFAHGLLSLVPRRMPEDFPVKSMGVSEDAVLMWHPEFVQNTPVKELAGVLVHELMHLVQRHAKRRRAIGADHAELWNCASDLEINDDVCLMEGLALPKDGLFPETYDLQPGKLAEEYYYELLERGEEQERPRPCCGSGAGNPMPGEEKCRGDGNAESPAQGGGDGEPGDGDQEGEAPGPVQGRSEAEMEAIRREIAHAVEAAKERGNVPAHLARWAAQELTPPKIDWRRQLSQVVRASVAWRPGAVDFRYDRPSRRQAAYGAHNRRAPRLPAMRQPVPRVAIAVDTSGSMSEGELLTALSESEGILRAVGAEVTLLVNDAEVREVRGVSTVAEMRAALKGGGGTDFAPVFTACAKLRPRPEVLIYITDGCGPAPANPPAGVRVIWLLVGPYKQAPHFAGAPFGAMIEVDDAEDATRAA